MIYKVIDIELDKNGQLSALLLEGKDKATPIKKIIDILANDDIDFSGSYLEVVNKKENPYIRTKANSNTDDNLDSIIEELQYRKDQANILAKKIIDADRKDPKLMKRLTAFFNFLK